MKRIVRTSVFETNSSSSHSISVAKGDMDFVMDTIYPDQDGVIKVFGQEFGWGWEKFNDSMTKLAYVFQDQGGSHNDLIVEVVKEQTGALEVIFDEAGGYIDHDGCGTAGEVVRNKEDLRQFIFNKNSWLFIGNDNSEPDPTFFDVPEFKGGRQILPRYKYELVIEGLENTTKYKEYPTDEELKIGIDTVVDDALLTKDGHFIVEDSFYWQISRPRNYYEKNWMLEQDYSKNEILFLKENDERFRDIEKKYAEDKRLRWDTKRKKVTEDALQVPDLIKKVKFELKPIVGNIELKDN
jgi:hypothetical protein